MNGEKIGKYLTLEEFCTCTQTYRTYKDQIHPFPENLQETIPAISALIEAILDPVIDEFGRDRFRLTYGFCSKDLKRYLEKKDPVTGQKNGRVAPELDQHLAHEVNQRGKYYCNRLGASCDFLILDLSSADLVEWILARPLPFDSLYFYGEKRPIHISYGPQHKRDIWTFTQGRQPTKKGIEKWVEFAKSIK
ncbi:hypothetical protein [Laspinema olomoucense]|uniref:hypothetical protein n=1 Tax=Laspinema olomoucense TaxID=3231600 RepID=UPI0021BB1385|nr:MULTISPECIES: hypothetical protein [unclassified Laspinema]MCT7974266.1 hypothetical protein [Laspinema sp. D3d]MCT7996945.1 hypothetical protein [Laspinema sp. D3c]